MKYKNPIIPGFYPDPSVCRVGDDFYLVTSSFEFFPGVPVFHSRNLVNWTQIGHCLTRDSQLPLAGCKRSGGIYAPTIRYHQGRFYMVTTNVSNGGHFYVWTEDPAGEWSEPIWVDQGGIDPDLFWDEDGTAYFSCTGGMKGVAQRKIDIEIGQFLSEVSHGWSGAGGKCPEAPHLYKIGDYYYLMIAEGGTEVGHCVTISRGTSPLGPWEGCPHNPILTHRSRALDIQATGHADLVEDQTGNWWMVCLGIRQKGYPPCHNLGRETFLTPIRWVDGWPVVGDSGEIALEMEGHDGLPAVTEISSSTRDEFDGDSLPLYWNFLANPRADVWSLTTNPGKLTLTCAKPGLSQMEGQAWLGRRQQHYDFRASCELNFAPNRDNEEAGITVFQNTTHHYDVALTRRNDVPTLVVRRTIGSLSAEVAAQPIPQESVVLVIEGDEEEYRFGYLGDDSKVAVLATGEIRYLSTEVGGAFTGVYLAMYATANGQASDNLAEFDWFEYKALTC